MGKLSLIALNPILLAVFFVNFRNRDLVYKSYIRIPRRLHISTKPRALTQQHNPDRSSVALSVPRVFLLDTTSATLCQPQSRVIAV